MFSMIALKFLNWIIGFLPSFGFDSVPVLETAFEVLNIFAWVNYFIPADVILALLSVNTAYYSFKLVWSLLMRIKDIIL